MRYKSRAQEMRDKVKKLWEKEEKRIKLDIKSIRIFREESKEKKSVNR